jgi:predicted Zn-dependent peptidase
MGRELVRRLGRTLGARPVSTTIKETFPNGLKLVTETMPHVRSAAIGVWLKRGSRHERPEESGLSHFIEHMVFKGTKNRSAERIAAEVDSIGGHMDAFTSKEYASFHLKVLDEHLPLAVEILADIVLNPLFDPGEMVKEKKVIFEEINLVEDTPDDLVMERFTSAFWPDHPLGRPILGTKKSVGSFTRGDLAAFFGSVYHAGNLLISAAGHLEHEAVSRLVREHFGGLPSGNGHLATQPPLPTSRIACRSKKELEQVHLCLGTPAYPQTHPRRFASYILNTVLGGSLSSRLFQNIREQRGLVYSIASGLATYSDAGALSVYAGTSLATANEVLRLTIEEMRRLRDERLPAEDLRRAKDHLKGSLVLALESTSSRMNQLARHEIYFGRQFEVREQLEAIEKVEAEDVRRTAEELFGGEVALSLLGNLGRYRPTPAQLRI